MASGADVYSTDDDPELVGAALPFALKTLEGLLAQDPTNRNLLLAAGRGFTQYAYGFVQMPADAIGDADFERVEAERQRALKLYLRARGYSLRGLETTHPGIGARLQQDPTAAAAELSRDDVPLAYWTPLPGAPPSASARTAPTSSPTCRPCARCWSACWRSTRRGKAAPCIRRSSPWRRRRPAPIRWRRPSGTSRARSSCPAGRTLPHT